MKKKWYFVHFVFSILLILFLLGWQAEKRKEAGLKSPAKKPAPAATPAAPVSAPAPPADPLSPEALIAVGEEVIFGSSRPKFSPNRGVQIGRGQCPACHVLLEEQKPNRFPRLLGIVERAGQRIQEERYRMFVKKHEAGEPNTGIKPHAKTPGEYIIESIYCPNCYVVDQEGVLENERMVSPMPIINKTGVGLSDYEMVAVAAYLQSIEAQGDLSKVTAKQDWENYFGKKLTPADVPEMKTLTAAAQDLSRVSLAQETPEQIIKKMGCYLCHTIPTVPIAQTGKIGPLLAMKAIAEQRIQSPEYQQALKEGTVRAKTAKAYVMESILDPGVFIAPGFDDAMPKDFKQKMTFGAIEQLSEFLITLDEEAAKKEGGAAPPAPPPGAKSSAQIRE